ncbi:hypothetical protein [Paraburkholderia caribensis]|uniref:hypothetical protein n=1 Tax=Paraburkholderia caribensis TaxID=75105 RepID=UPI0034D277F0
MSAIKHSPGPWTVDTIDNEGEYSLGGDESACGFKSHAVLDANGRVLFDSLNSEVAEIHEEIDEDARYAWDGQSECDLRLAAAAPELLEALQYALPYLEACVPNPRNGVNADYSVDVNCVDRARAAIAKATGAQS